ncbi:hypothetical protein M378DRAFT_821860 [Amanita muscaria Koide BX008]|uniref:Uncharacterized protein n=1 Tax=Amanita muscaria (strain Koide BX008) TaxID=946122 RepID=A0A0C2X3E4_AMAMK|nr:hypothetical protein M378DRAFT_821860 [Amanita muscaria Koide BX008]
MLFASLTEFGKSGILNVLPRPGKSQHPNSTPQSLSSSSGINLCCNSWIPFIPLGKFSTSDAGVDVYGRWEGELDDKPATTRSRK